MFSKWCCCLLVYVVPDLEELQLGLALGYPVVAAVEPGQLLLDGRLLHLIQHRHGQVVLQPEVRLPMQLRHPKTLHALISPHKQTPSR